MNWDKFSRIITILGATAALAVTVNVTTDYFVQKKRIEQIKEFDLSNLESKIKILDPKITKPKSLVESKKERLKNVPPISFHFADEERIRSFYNDYFREPTTESLVKEIVSEASGETGANMADILEAKIGTKSVEKWVRNIKLPETSISGMFRRYQRETIENNQVALDLEIIDLELGSLSAFRELIKKLKTEYDFPLQSDQIAKGELKLKANSAEKILKRLEEASGPVLIEGKFQIEESKDEFYRCTVCLR